MLVLRGYTLECLLILCVSLQLHGMQQKGAWSAWGLFFKNPKFQEWMLKNADLSLIKKALTYKSSQARNEMIRQEQRKQLQEDNKQQSWGDWLMSWLKSSIAKKPSL